MRSPEGSHDFFMEAAITHAEQAFHEGEVPIGAIIIDKNNTIIGSGYNKVEQNSCQTSHAELIAIKQACLTLGTWRLDDCWLYVTLEPCLMCLGAIGISRLSGVAYGAASPEFGGISMLTWKRSPIYFKRLMILKGLKAIECTDLLENFFKKNRNCP